MSAGRVMALVLVVVVLWALLAGSLWQRAFVAGAGDDPIEIHALDERARNWTPTVAPPTTTTTTAPPATTTTTVARARTAPMAASAAGPIGARIRRGFARFGAAVAAQAVRVARCETAGTLNPGSTGSAGERGLFQIHPRYHQARIARLGLTWARMYEVDANITVAADLYADSGWRPWSCRYAA